MILLQSYRWDVFSWWIQTMHKRPLSDDEFKRFSANDFVPVLSHDVLVLLHELRPFAPQARWSIVIAPAPLYQHDHLSNHNLMAHPSSIEASTNAVHHVAATMQDVEIMNWAESAAELDIECVANDRNRIRLECLTPLINLINRSLATP
jgi:hypothetical protein